MSLDKKLILIAGSSIMEHWKQLANLSPVVPMENIAIGGTTTLEWKEWAQEKIGLRRPAGLIFYCGSNDYNRGFTTTEIFERTKSILNLVISGNPTIKILYFHVMASPQKEPKWPELKYLKEQLENYFTDLPQVKSVDPNPLFFKEGRPRHELFIEDGVHLTSDAYEEWGKIFKPILEAYFGGV